MRLATIRRALFDLPRQGQLVYCLVRDERIAATHKAGLLGTLGFIVSPWDLPAWVPIIGQLDGLALSALAMRTFIHASPPDIVAEHERALASGTSQWHQDYRELGRQLSARSDRLLSRIRRRMPNISTQLPAA
jgi:uncharacterized membrane protein YkvA (DUF1232 family)